MMQTNGILPPTIENPPELLGAVNKHGLAIFLIVSYSPFPTLGGPLG
jgi:hypothetical protein